MSFCAVVVTKLPDSSTDTGVVIFKKGLSGKTR
jgi:hypothetical protein